MQTQEATNQGLQSANEEIRSIERELQTVNEELTKVADDLKNVFANTDAALLLVGGNLRLHRFTSQAQKLFGILSDDIGRSIAEIPQFSWLAQRISSEFEAFEAEFADDRSEYFKFKVLPYRTSNNRIDGAVIKIVKIVRET
jgi:two-component system, chemotaxis family, CheB/CheR fusion protein